MQFRGFPRSHVHCWHLVKKKKIEFNKATLDPFQSYNYAKSQTEFNCVIYYRPKKVI
jgi:hypothetical protein